MERKLLEASYETKAIRDRAAAAEAHLKKTAQLEKEKVRGMGLSLSGLSTIIFFVKEPELN